jgi:hypothetical protein
MRPFDVIPERVAVSVRDCGDEPMRSTNSGRIRRRPEAIWEPALQRHVPAFGAGTAGTIGYLRRTRVLYRDIGEPFTEKTIQTW